MIQLPERLKRALQRQLVVPFVGAGVSKFTDPQHFPSWTELIQSLAAEAQKRKHITSSEYKDILKDLTPAMHGFAAEILRRRMPKDEFELFLEKKFRIDSRGLDLRVQKLLLDLKPRVVVTTNFDRLLEDSLARSTRIAPSIATNAECLKVHNRLRRTVSQENPLIFKIHGDIDDLDTIVIGDRDFGRLMHEEKLFETVLTNIFLNYTIVFVGYSLSDPEIEFHLERIRHLFKHSVDPDYIILADGQKNSMELQRWRQEYGVEAIFYPRDPKHTALPQVIRAMVRCV